jgi:hypothetical protein
MTNHPIIPPPELVAQWTDKAEHWEGSYEIDIATQAAQWGADQELEACCEWVKKVAIVQIAENLRAARRPKPPSLKEQALEALERQCLRSISPLVSTSDLDTIRRALEALPND